MSPSSSSSGEWGSLGGARELGKAELQVVGVIVQVDPNLQPHRPALARPCSEAGGHAALVGDRAGEPPRQVRLASHRRPVLPSVGRRSGADAPTRVGAGRRATRESGGPLALPADELLRGLGGRASSRRRMTTVLPSLGRTTSPISTPLGLFPILSPKNRLGIRTYSGRSMVDAPRALALAPLSIEKASSLEGTLSTRGKVNRQGYRGLGTSGV